MEELGQGRLLEEVLGEVLTVSEIATRLVTPKRRAAAKTSASHFLLSLGLALGGGGGEYLDMTDKASLWRFVNHSTSPNCEIQVGGGRINDVYVCKYGFIEMCQSFYVV